MKGGFGLQLEIHNKKVEKLFQNPNYLIKKVGKEMTIKIKQRLNEIRSSCNFKEYLDIGLGKPHPLVGNLDGLYGISLNGNYRLIVEPLIQAYDFESLKKCIKINIKGVMNYHDGKCEWIIP